MAFKHYRKVLGYSSKLDPVQFKSNSDRWVLIYGATNHIGKLAAHVFAKNGYSLILVDSSLDKLQKLTDTLLRVFPHLKDENLAILNLNFAIWRDSTSLEYKIREVIDLDKQIPLLINCMSFLNEWQVCEDKLYHEVQFDQLYQYTGNTVIGFSVLLNFFTRLIVHKKQQSCLINITKKEVKPWDRTSYAMAFLRVLYYPIYYH